MMIEGKHVPSDDLMSLGIRLSYFSREPIPTQSNN
jgi:hypothetical protein